MPENGPSVRLKWVFDLSERLLYFDQDHLTQRPPTFQGKHEKINCCEGVFALVKYEAF